MLNIHWLVQCGCIPHKDMNEHRGKCPLEMINCEYHAMGCEVRMTRQMQNGTQEKNGIPLTFNQV